jgi:hypothetical protein
MANSRFCLFYSRCMGFILSSPICHAKALNANIVRKFHLQTKHQSGSQINTKTMGISTKSGGIEAWRTRRGNGAGDENAHTKLNRSRQTGPIVVIPAIYILYIYSNRCICVCVCSLKTMFELIYTNDIVHTNSRYVLS